MDDDKLAISIVGGAIIFILAIFVLQIKITIPILGEITLLNAIVLSVLGVIGIVIMAGIQSLLEMLGFK